MQGVNRGWDQLVGGISRFRSWLDLCRLPYSMAVAADPLAGALIVGAGWSQIPFAIALMLAAFFIHAGAVVLNDWHDFKTDRVENPDRPVAAGQVGRWYALLAAVILLATGWTLAAVPGHKCGQMGLVLLAVVLLHEFIMKGAPAGKAIPGVARALALLLGMLLVPVTASTAGWGLRVFCMSVLAVYMLGAAVLAQRPPDHLRRTIAVSGGIIMAVAILVLGAMRLFFPSQAVHPIAAAWIGVLLIVVGHPLVRAILRPGDATLRSAAWAAVLGSILVNATFVAFVRNLPVSLPIAAAIVPLYYVRRLMDRAPEGGPECMIGPQQPQIPSQTS